MVNNSSLHAVIYLRISLDQTGEGLAVERQLADCKRIAGERGWTVVETYSDTVSASKRNVVRPSYDRMLRDYEAGRFNALICWDLDRLTRQPRQLEDWIDLAELKGLVIVTANGEADLSNDNGRMFARIKASVARGEIERKSARQKSKNLQRAASGQPVPGRRRFGYLADNMTPHPEESTQAQWAFEQIRTGQTLRSTAVAMGMRPVRVREMLTNPSYQGDVVHKGVALPSTLVTPLVTREVFAEVNAILSDPARKTSPGNTIRYVASGIARCGVCGAPIHHQNEYMCSASTAHVFIQKKQLEPLIASEAFRWIADHPDRDDNTEGVLSPLLVQAAEVVRQRNVVQDLAEMRGADMTAVRKRLAALGKQSEALEARIAAERSGAARHGVLEEARALWWGEVWEAESLTELLNIAEAHEKWSTFWAGMGLDRQREIIRGMFTITVHKGRGLERVVFEDLD